MSDLFICMIIIREKDQKRNYINTKITNCCICSYAMIDDAPTS